MVASIRNQIRYTLPIWGVQLLMDWWPENTLTCRVRGAALKFFLGSCGSRFAIGKHVQINFGHRFCVGNDCYIARNCWIQAMGNVLFEDEVVCGPYVTIASTNHLFRNGSTVGAGTRPQPIRVGRGTWIGAHAVLTAGVTVGRGNLIAAGAVVTRDTPDNVVIGGVPARVLGPRQDDVQPQSLCEAPAGIRAA